MSSSNPTVAGALVALGLAIAGLAVGAAIVESRAPERRVTVKGLAERDVEADLALWSLSFVATGDDLAGVQQQIDDDERRVRAFLERGGIADDEVSVQELGVSDRLANAYYSGPVRSRYVVRKTLLVRTANVEAIAERSESVSGLVLAGVVLSSESGPRSLQPAYLFTRLNEIKPPMIAEATRNARAAAEQFATDAEAELGDLVEARQGLFQILARDKAPQLQEANQRLKTVRVVSTLRFALD